MKDKLLDRFLFEIKRDAERDKKRSSALVPQVLEVSIYANPDNWYTTRVIELICRTLEGADESLGFFKEERHRISLSARRLRPCTDEEGGFEISLRPGFCPGQETVPQEVVRGDHWLYAKQISRLIDPPGEVEALKALFQELIGEA